MAQRENKPSALEAHIAPLVFIGPEFNVGADDAQWIYKRREMGLSELEGPINVGDVASANWGIEIEVIDGKFHAQFFFDTSSRGKRFGPDGVGEGDTIDEVTRNAIKNADEEEEES